MEEQRKFGALWIKENDRGEYMTGELIINGQKVSIICFKNTHKIENPKCPDWDILKAGEREQGLKI